MQDLMDGAVLTSVAIAEWGGSKSNALVCGDEGGDVLVLQ